MRLFKAPQQLFSRSSMMRHVSKGGAANANANGVDASIGSDISSKDQFDILVPTTKLLNNNNNNNNKPTTTSARSSSAWGGVVVGMQGLLERTAGAAADADDHTSVSSITTSPEWQQHPAKMMSDGYNDDKYDGAHPHSRNNRSTRTHTTSASASSSWACCCAPMGAHMDDQTMTASPISITANTENTLAPTTHQYYYQPSASSINEASPAAGTAVNDNKEMVSPPNSPVAAAAVSETTAWCCAGGLGGVDASSTTGSASRHNQDRSVGGSWRNHSSLFDTLEDDPQLNRQGNLHKERSIKKLGHSLRRAIPWVSQRTRSFRVNRQRHATTTTSGAATTEPLAILATTHQDDNYYYWRGNAAAE